MKRVSERLETPMSILSEAAIGNSLPSIVTNQFSMGNARRG
jgi:hypothetical protein